jgi:hypothetical protein
VSSPLFARGRGFVAAELLLDVCGQRLALLGRSQTPQWLDTTVNCSSSVEPVSAVTEELPPWMQVVTWSK